MTYMTLPRFAGICAALLLALGLAGPAASQNAKGKSETGANGPSQFTEQQREEIGRLVRRYLIENPEVLEEAIRELQARREERRREQSAAAVKEHRAALFNDETSPVGGNPDGDITIVEFFDYQCGFCKRAFPHMQAAVRSDGNVRIVFKEWPVLGPVSQFAARAALASRKQGKYEEFHNALMGFEGRLSNEIVLQIAGSVGIDARQLQEDMKDPQIDRILDRNDDLAQSLGIQGTPAFVIGDELIPGAIEEADFNEYLSQARSNCQSKVC